MPFGKFVTDTLVTVLGWAKDWVLPIEGGKVAWFRLVCLVLTLAWMIWSTEKTRKFFNGVGGWVVAAIFFAIAAGILMSIPMFFWNFFDIHWIFKILLFGILFFFIGGLIKWVGGILWSGIKAVFGWARAIPQHAKANPNLGYMIAGGLFLAGLICGQKATMLTEKWGLIAGIIPGISGAAGLITLAYRTFFGRWIMDKALRQYEVNESGAGKCPNEGKKICKDKKGNKIPDPKRPGKYKTETVKCGGWILPHDAKCPNPNCKQLNPFYILKCRKCGFAGETGKGFKRDHWRKVQKCPRCGHLHPPVKVPMGFRNVKAPEKAQAKPESVQTAAAALQQKVCSSCGKSVPAKAQACPHCGIPVVPPTGSAAPPMAGHPPAAPSAVAAPTATATLTLTMASPPVVAPPAPAPAPASIPPSAPKQFRRRPGHRSLKDKWR